jgi:CRP/FNR family cyclic AMP-dependent transcriptional regulator
MMALMPPKRGPRRPRTLPAFDLNTFLASAGLSKKIVTYADAAVIFAQGDAATDVFYLQEGRVKVSVLSRTGKEAVVAVVGPGAFFGEGCLAGQSHRMSTASAIGPSVALVVKKRQMLDVLRTQPALAERFLSHMLARNIRIEEDLVDQLFNSSEKRLARALLLLARYGKEPPPLLVPRLSQETLAEMVGTTRSRVNFFMNKFRDMGLIEYNGDIKVNSALLTVILHD